MMLLTQRSLVFVLVVGLALLSQTCQAFIPSPSVARPSTQRAAFLPSSSVELAADPLDPTAVLSDTVGGLVDSPAILAVPVVAVYGCVTRMKSRVEKASRLPQSRSRCRRRALHARS